MIIAATRYGKVGGSRGLPKYACSGIAPVTREDSETGNWEMHFLGNCTITFTEDVEVDVFAVGGGQAGGSGKAYLSHYAYGGDGGAGGEIVNSTITLTGGVSYTVTIGESGTQTSVFGIVASAGTGAAGGYGARSGTDQADPKPQRDSTQGGPGQYAFGQSTTDGLLFNASTKYGAGGGGGGANSRSASNGGDTGGGAGGSGDSASEGSAGQANTGAGGGGGGSTSDYGSQWGTVRAGGAGGSGICIIRNARTSS